MGRAQVGTGQGGADDRVEGVEIDFEADFDAWLAELQAEAALRQGRAGPGPGDHDVRPCAGRDLGPAGAEVVAGGPCLRRGAQGGGGAQASSGAQGSRGTNPFTLERRARFAQDLAQHGNVRLACQAVGVSPETAYKARRRDRAFAAAWDGAVLLARTHVESVLAERALNGVDEPVFYRGEEVARRRRFDTRLLLAHLARLDAAAERPDTSEAAERFDEWLALSCGADPQACGIVPERVVVPEPGAGEAARAVLPPPRMAYCNAAELAEVLPPGAAPSHAGPYADERCADDLGEDEDENEFDADREAALMIEAMRRRGAAWDAWRRHAEAFVDRLVDGPPSAPDAAGDLPIEVKGLVGADDDDLWLSVWEGGAGGAAETSARTLSTLSTPAACSMGESGGGSAGDAIEPDAAGAAALEAQFGGGGFADVDDPAVAERAAIVDPHHDAAVAAFHRHADPAAEGQGAVRGGQLGGVEAFAARGALARMGRAIPAGHATAGGLEGGFDSVGGGDRLDQGERRAFGDFRFGFNRLHRESGGGGSPGGRAEPGHGAGGKCALAEEMSQSVHGPGRYAGFPAGPTPWGSTRPIRATFRPGYVHLRTESGNDSAVDPA
jgi:hypothetical protein